MLTALAFVWTLPNTIIGLLLGAFTFRKPRLGPGCLRFDTAPPRGYAKLIPKFGYTAQTFGFVVLGSEPVEGHLLNHELGHRRQYMLLGPLFLPVYLVLFLRYGYKRHPFELAAERRALGLDQPR